MRSNRAAATNPARARPPRSVAACERPRVATIAVTSLNAAAVKKQALLARSARPFARTAGTRRTNPSSWVGWSPDRRSSGQARVGGRVAAGRAGPPDANGRRPPRCTSIRSEFSSKVVLHKRGCPYLRAARSKPERA